MIVIVIVTVIVNAVVIMIVIVFEVLEYLLVGMEVRLERGGGAVLL